LAELVSGGLITSDSFTGLRALLLPAKHKGQKRNRHMHFKLEEAGRWSLVEKNKIDEETQLSQSELIQLCYVLLRRYGVVFRKLVDREKIMPPWRDLVKVFRLLEARGEIRGGRFVSGVWGEQFALKEAVAKLRTVKKTPGTGNLVSISAMDPLNLTNIITPGGRVPAFMNNRILYLDGVPIAIKNGKEIQFTQTLDKDKTWEYQNALIQRQISPKLKAYLGKGIF
ncbi:MAG: Lhr family helicase, partial [Cyclobacteriaceae bacterium]